MRSSTHLKNGSVTEANSCTHILYASMTELLGMRSIHVYTGRALVPTNVHLVKMHCRGMTMLMDVGVWCLIHTCYDVPYVRGFRNAFFQ